MNHWPVLLLGLLLAGCAARPTPPANQPMPAALVDAPQQHVDEVQVALRLVSGWTAQPAQHGRLYIHQQWRSPSRQTMVGVVYVRMPLPVSARTLVWLAKGEMEKRSLNSRFIRHGTDTWGREWCEATNSRYWIYGYCVARGFEAWVSYYARRADLPTEDVELARARTSMESVVPLPMQNDPGRPDPRPTP